MLGVCGGQSEIENLVVCNSEKETRSHKGESDSINNLIEVVHCESGVCGPELQDVGVESDSESKFFFYSFVERFCYISCPRNLDRR